MTTDKIKKKLNLNGSCAIGNFSEGRVYVERDGDCGIADEDGNIIVPIGKYEFVSDMHNGRICAYHNNFGYLDSNGNVVIPFMYDDAKNFFEGQAKVEYGSLEFFIDVHGVPVDHEDCYLLIKEIFK